MPYAIHSAICHHLPSILTMIPLKTLGSHISPRQKLPAALFQRGDEWPGSAMRSMRKSANFRRSSALAMLSLCAPQSQHERWSLDFEFSNLFHHLKAKRTKNSLQQKLGGNWMEIGWIHLENFTSFFMFLHLPMS